jgi:hypothetical protein
VRRLGVDVGQKFKIRELSSIETLLEAYDKYVFDSRFPERHAKEAFLCRVAQTGNFDFIKYFWKVKKCRWSDDVIKSAARSGHIELLRFLYRMKKTIKPTACDAASSAGKLECLKFLVEELKVRPSFSDVSASSNGHVHILQYLLEKGMGGHPQCCEFAASHGQLEALKFLHQNQNKNRPFFWSWNRKTLQLAQKNGHWDCYNYAKEHGCPE